MFSFDVPFRIFPGKVEMWDFYKMLSQFSTIFHAVHLLIPLLRHMVPLNDGNCRINNLI